MSTTTQSALDVDEIAANKESADLDFSEAVDSRFLSIAEDAGFVTDEKLDKKLLAKKAYEVLKDKHVLSIDPDKDDRRDPSKSTHKEELAEELFPGTPSGSDADTNLVAAKVRERCLSAIWNITQTSDRGQVQKLLRADNLILIRGTVFRGSVTINDGIFVSTHQEVVMREFLAPRLEKLRKLTEAIEGDYAMATDRVPALEGPMKAAIEAALVEATAKLPVATLESGQSDGRKALGK